MMTITQKKISPKRVQIDNDVVCTIKIIDCLIYLVQENKFFLDTFDFLRKCLYDAWNINMTGMRSATGVVGAVPSAVLFASKGQLFLLDL